VETLNLRPIIVEVLQMKRMEPGPAKLLRYRRVMAALEESMKS
jgi:hypothetical protein